jgi:hypothetical protein
MWIRIRNPALNVGSLLEHSGSTTLQKADQKSNKKIKVDQVELHFSVTFTKEELALAGQTG